jgi:hypothetical protein
MTAKKLYLLILITISIVIYGCNIVKVLDATKDEKISFINNSTKFKFFENQIILETEYANGIKRNFLLDLGSPISIVFTDSTINNDGGGVSISSKPRRTKSADGKGVDRNYFNWGTIKTNLFLIENSILSTINRNDLLDCNALGGIWGADLFAPSFKGKDNKILLIRMEDSTISILDKLPNLDNWNRLNTNFNMVSHIKINSTIGNQKTALYFDTGFSGKLLLDNKTFNKIKNEENRFFYYEGKLYGLIHSSLAGLANPDTLQTAFTDLKLSPDIYIDSIQVVTIENMVVNALGMEFFKQYNILVDYQKQELYLQPNPAYKVIERNFFQSNGFKVKSLNNEEIIVVNIEKGSVAEKAGIKIGDHLISINDLLVDETASCETFRALQTIKFKPFDNEVTVRRNGEIIKFRL